MEKDDAKCVPVGVLALASSPKFPTPSRVRENFNTIEANIKYILAMISAGASITMLSELLEVPSPDLIIYLSQKRLRHKYLKAREGGALLRLEQSEDDMVMLVERAKREFLDNLTPETQERASRAVKQLADFRRQIATSLGKAAARDAVEIEKQEAAKNAQRQSLKRRPFGTLTILHDEGAVDAETEDESE